MVRINLLLTLLLVVAPFVGACQPLIQPQAENLPQVETLPMDSPSGVPALETDPLLRMTITLNEPRDIGSGPLGSRYVFYFTGGVVTSSQFSGAVLPDGEHWFLIRTNNTSEVNLSGIFQTDDGQNVDFMARGFCHVAPLVVEQAQMGDLVDPSDAIFRGVIFFETAAPRYEWLNHTVTIALFHFDLHQVEITVYTLG